MISQAEIQNAQELSQTSLLQPKDEAKTAAVSAQQTAQIRPASSKQTEETKSSSKLLENNLNSQNNPLEKQSAESDVESDDQFDDEDEEQENLEDYDQEQDGSDEEASEESDDSAPYFNKIKLLLKENELAQAEDLHDGSGENETPLPVKQNGEQNKISRWMLGADKINRRLQALAIHMAKEAQQNNPGATYSLNSYAFHCRPLINSMLSYLPVGFDRVKIETLFIESAQTDGHQPQHEQVLLLSESTEKMRKRALISSTFATALRVQNVMRIFRDLRHCKTAAPQLFKRAASSFQATTNTQFFDKQGPQGAFPIQQRQFRKELEKTLTQLVSKYDPTSNQPAYQQNKHSQILLPSLPKPVKKPQMPLDPEEFSDDETYYKQRAVVLKYKGWRYSLLCSKNAVQYELPPEPQSSQKDSSPKKASRQCTRKHTHAAQELHLGRSPHLGVAKRPVVTRNTQKQHKKGDELHNQSWIRAGVSQAQTMSQINNHEHLKASTASSARRNVDTSYGLQGDLSHQMVYQHCSESRQGSSLQQKRGQTTDDTCPVHYLMQSQVQRSHVGLNQIDLGGVILKQNPIIEPCDSYEQLQRPMGQTELELLAGQKKIKNHSMLAHQGRSMNPFKQDRKRMAAAKQMMTINGRIRHAGNQQKQLIYDPKLMAHLAKMYMGQQGNHNQQKKSLFPLHLQQQLLGENAVGDPRFLYNRTVAPGGKDMLLSGAVEDLIKRKFLFADQKTSQKSNKIYNQDVQIFQKDLGWRQFDQERAIRHNAVSPGVQISSSSELSHLGPKKKQQMTRKIASVCGKPRNQIDRLVKNSLVPKLQSFKPASFTQRAPQSVPKVQIRPPQSQADPRIDLDANQGRKGEGMTSGRQSQLFMQQATTLYMGAGQKPQININCKVNSCKPYTDRSKAPLLGQTAVQLSSQAQQQGQRPKLHGAVTRNAMMQDNSILGKTMSTFPSHYKQKVLSENSSTIKSSAEDLVVSRINQNTTVPQVTQPKKWNSQSCCTKTLSSQNPRRPINSQIRPNLMNQHISHEYSGVQEVCWIMEKKSALAIAKPKTQKIAQQSLIQDIQKQQHNLMKSNLDAASASSEILESSNLQDESKMCKIVTKSINTEDYMTNANFTNKPMNASGQTSNDNKSQKKNYKFLGAPPVSSPSQEIKASQEIQKQWDQHDLLIEKMASMQTAQQSMHNQEQDKATYEFHCQSQKEQTEQLAPNASLVTKLHNQMRRGRQEVKEQQAQTTTTNKLLI